MAVPASFSTQEKAYYDRLFSVIDKDQSGVLPGQDALPFLVSSNLPQQTLGEVWAVADPENNGFLTKEGWYKAARLIGWMQKGGQSQVDESLTARAGPYPTFAGQAPPPQQQPLSAQVTGQSQRGTTLGPSLPPLTAADRAKFTKIFVGCGPQNGLVSGDKARDVFLKSQLGYDKLGQIWTLADTQQRGSLDLPDFIIGMYLIQSCMANSSLSLPAALPPNLYEQASGGRAPPSSPIDRQNTGPASPMRPQYTGQVQPQLTGQGMAAQATGRSAFAPPPPPSAQAQWDITPDAKATSDRFFAQLDPQNRGVIEGDVAVPFMLQSQLDETALASIWDLADIRKEGKLTKDEFAVAMYLINGKLAGREVPAVLPNSLIPPSLRGEFSGEQASASGPSAITRDLFDLFADDPAPASATAPAPAPPPATASPARGASTQPQPFSPAAFLPQPPSRKGTAPPPPASRALSPSATGGSMNAYPSSFAAPPRLPSNDLLGDDSAPADSAGPDRSAELGNKQNQLASTERSNADLAKQRMDLESSTASVSAQLEELEQRLSYARVKHEAETKAVTDLRARVSEQQSKSKTLNNDLISAESDVSALKSEKDELEQALLRDKEEVRGLQRRMKEVEDEKTGLKLVLEKLKKEARQQKGMVTIAKKQLTTAETSRDGVQNDIKTEEASQAAGASALASPPAPAAREPSPFAPSPSIAAGIPLPATPQALSPVATGMSQRSNNPFDRLRSARSPAPGPETPQEQGVGTSALLGAGAVVGAAAGVVAAGASTLFEAAKHVVSPENEASALPDINKAADSKPGSPHNASTDMGQAEVAPESHETTVAQSEQDPFGTSDQQTKSAPVDVDPFGAPSRSATTTNPAGPSFDDFESGFGDSFSAPQTEGVDRAKGGEADFDSGFAAAPATTAPSAQQASAFDSEFDSFDDPAPVAPVAASAVAAQQRPGSDFDSAFADFNQNEIPDGLPTGIPKSAVPYLRPDAERTASTQAVAADSRPDSPGVPPVPSDAQQDDGSSDEDEGPEDLDQPNKMYGAKTGTLDRSALPQPSGLDIDDAEEIKEDTNTKLPLPPQLTETSSTGDVPSKARRSAPPPPAKSGSSVLAPPIDDFDPFGASAPAPAAPPSTEPQPFGQLPPGAAPSVPSDAAASNNAFDEDDFDFSDQPPVQVDNKAQPQQQDQNGFGAAPISASASKDDFDFDDEFDKPSTGQGSEGSNSNGMSKSYEMVSPPPPQVSNAQSDPWGSQPFGSSAPTQSAPGSGFSFDDAFGGDFEPAPSQAQTQPQAPAQQFSAPAGPPPGRSGNLSAPPLPQRRDSEAQPDDIEDVKKLCQMGFPRNLVIEALAANSYDFQKTLNVLLQ